MYQTSYRMQSATLHAPQRAPANYTRFRVQPISGSIGAFVHDADLKDCDDTTFTELCNALHDHLVIFARDQQLTPEEQITLARRFGPPIPWPYADKMPGYPEITEIRSEPTDTFNFGGSWHQDSLNLERPPKITMAYAIDVPTIGGDTSYANQYLAWESLDNDMKERLDNMKAVNSASKSYSGGVAHKDQLSTPLTFTQDQENEVEHPIAQVHPVTGRKALYVNSAFTARFSGMSEDESLPLLHELWERAITPEFTCRFSWEQGTLAIWDNRCCMHYAHNDYAGERRLLRRIAIEGDRPV